MKRYPATIALLALLIPATSFGWGRDGHRIVGYIAEQFLRANAAAAVRELLCEQILAGASTRTDEIEHHHAKKGCAKSA